MKQCHPERPKKLDGCYNDYYDYSPACELKPIQWCNDCGARYCVCQTTDDAILINQVKHAHKRLTSIERDGPQYQRGCMNMLKYLHALQKNSKICDLAFKMKDRVYYAHKIALSYHSEKYREIFEKKCSDNGMFTIQLCYTTDDALKDILHYIYTCEVDLTPANADELLKGATELGIYI